MPVDGDAEVASLDVDTPDYRERLAYGTDQGRWLMQQVGSSTDGAPAKRRARTPSRHAYHAADEPTSVEMAPEVAGHERRSWKPMAAVLGVLALLGVVSLLYSGEDRAL